MPVSKLESALLRLAMKSNRQHSEAAVVSIIDMIDAGQENFNVDEIFTTVTQKMLDQSALEEQNRKANRYEDVEFFERPIELADAQTEVNTTEKIGPWTFDVKSGDTEDK